ncbi:MAG: hypothetical protein SFX19_03615 [Alphaproteobacteria bacterium]|nr:hypothetical protein [Alphaproteobacteria bacterium]
MKIIAILKSPMFSAPIGRRWAQDGLDGRLAVRAFRPVATRRARDFHLGADFGEADIREAILFRQLEDGHRPDFIIELVALEGNDLGNLAFHSLSDKLLAAEVKAV